MYRVLGLTDKYPHDSLGTHILDVVTQFLPTLFSPYIHRGRVRQIISNVKLFQCGERKGSIQTGEVYSEHCSGWGTLSETNKAVTSNSIPNADPINIDLLRTKHPEPAHPDRDPVSLSSILWTQPQTLKEYWSSDAGAEFLDKCFSIPKISEYFHTISPVTMTDTDQYQSDDLNVQDLIGPLAKWHVRVIR